MSVSTVNNNNDDKKNFKDKIENYYSKTCL